MGTNPTNYPMQPDYSVASDASTYKANIDGAINMLKQLAWAFAPSAQSTENMTVRVNAGSIFVGGSRVDVAAQSTSTLTAPTSNPRIDLVYVDQATGAVGVETGTEDATPAAPSTPSGKIPIAEIEIETTSTVISDTMITDVRPGFMPYRIGTDVLAPDGDGSNLSGFGGGAYVDLQSQAEAEAGTDNTGYMSALRVAQAIAALFATQAAAEAGTATDVLMSPLRVAQAIAALSGGGGEWELVASDSIPYTSKVAEITQTLDPDNYNYRIEIDEIRPDNGSGHFRLGFKNSGISTYTTTVYGKEIENGGTPSTSSNTYLDTISPATGLPYNSMVIELYNWGRTQCFIKAMHSASGTAAPTITEIRAMVYENATGIRLYHQSDDFSCNYKIFRSARATA